MFLCIWSKPYEDGFCFLVNLPHLTDLMAEFMNVWLVYAKKLLDLRKPTSEEDVFTSTKNH